jgi:hypothetical protein
MTNAFFPSMKLAIGQGLISKEKAATILQGGRRPLG